MFQTHLLLLAASDIQIIMVSCYNIQTLGLQVSGLALGINRHQKVPPPSTRPIQVPIRQCRHGCTDLKAEQHKQKIDNYEIQLATCT